MDPSTAIFALIVDIRLIYSSTNQLTVIGVNSLQKTFIRGGKPVRFESIDLVELIRPGNGIRLNVPLPASDMSDMLSFIELVPAVFEFFFRPSPFCHFS